MNRKMTGWLAGTIFTAIWASVLHADTQWFLMSRHGECVDIASLKRKVPDLGLVQDPDAFIKLMRDKGHRVTMHEPSVPTGRFVEITVPDRELALVFVTTALCRSVEAR
jgi:hypothetical protein